MDQHSTPRSQRSLPSGEHPLLHIGALHNRVQVLENARDDHSDRLKAVEERLNGVLHSLWEPFAPHVWKVILGFFLLLLSRLKTGEWPDPISVIERLLSH